MLPALPDNWTKGEVKGLRARGGFELDMKWENSRITYLAIRSTAGGNCRIRVDEKHKPLKLEMLDITAANTNPFYQISEIKQPVVNPSIAASVPAARQFKELDLTIRKDEAYKADF